MNRLLYTAYTANRALTAPSRVGSGITLKLLESRPAAMRTPVGRHLAAISSVIAGTQLTHTRPDFAHGTPFVDGDGNPIADTVVDSTPFASLVRFAPATPEDAAAPATPRPRVLLLAPLSGHFATMLEPTIRTMVTDHDVYITDWRNARDVPVEEGRFGLDEFVDHVVRFMRVVGPGSHMMAVCQPCVPAVMATAVLARDNDAAQPLSLVLMAGPIDTRANPTRINKLAYKQSLTQYRRMLTTVPRQYRGGGRAVYPGFLQIGGFISLNARRHLDSRREIYRSYARGEGQSSQRTRTFYDEYFAVLDMPAEFYLETIERIFQDDLLAKGEMTHHGRTVDPSAITRTALLTVEAERDDMCAVGQTAAAHDLFTGIAPELKRSYVQAGVGHYGIFAGSRWSAETYPVVREFIHEFADIPDTD